MKEKVTIGRLFKTIACATLTLALTCSLAACGKSMPSNPTASEAFNAGGVWYHSSSTDLDKIAKDTKIDQVFIFQNGEVTLYDFDCAAYRSRDIAHMEKDDKHFNSTDMSNTSIQLTYGDLNKLSQKDIIALVKNTHSANFEANKKATIEKCTYEIDRLQPAIKGLEKDVNDLVAQKDEIIAELAPKGLTYNPIDPATGKRLYEPEEEYNNMLKPRQNALENWKELLTFYQVRLETLNSLTYQEPKPVKYELAIKTDKSGNAATNESLNFEAEILDLEAFLHADISRDSTDAPYTSKKQNITFGVGGAFQTVYDTRFGGYDELFTIIDSATNPYILDSRDSKGVTVD